MLVLSRKLNESIVIDGKIFVKILRIEKDTVKLGIQAPLELSVHRQEVFDSIQRGKLTGAAAAVSAGDERPLNSIPLAPAEAGPDPVSQ